MTIRLLIPILLISMVALGQGKRDFVPMQEEKPVRYLFYLHGGVVAELGDNAVNRGAPEWGPYEYSNILDSLRKSGFTVISEIRKKGVDNQVYIEKVSFRIDSLLRRRVRARDIVVLGASAGSDIALAVSSRLRNSELRFVIMGGCWPDTYKDYVNLELAGHFLSIVEKSDPHGTCGKLFEGRTSQKSFREIALDTGLSHGFFYKGRKVWIEPIVDWLNRL